MPQESNERQDLLLKRVAEDLVRIGEEVGVSPENLISMLDSGMSLRKILDWLESKCAGRSA